MSRVESPVEQWKQHVLRHTDLTPLAERLWQVTGTLKRMPLPRNMIVYQLQSGGLLIHSAIALDEPTMQRLLKLGEPEVMIVPSRLHRLDAGVYKQRFPNLQVICPESERIFVQKMVKLDGTCEQILPALGVRYHQPQGLKPVELTYELDIGQARALVFCDALFNLEQHLKGIQGWMIRVLGSSGFFGLTKLGKLSLLEDAAAYKSWLEELAGLPDLAVISVAHGAAITQSAAQRLKEAAARL